MEALITPFLQLFSLLALGFYLARKGLFGEGFNKALSTFLLRWSLPALILASMQRPFSLENLQQAGLLVLISLGIYTLCILTALVWGGVQGGSSGTRGLFQFALIFSNVGFMGFPILEALWGRDILFWVAIYNMPFHFLVFSLGIWLVSRDPSPVKGEGKGFRFHPRELLNPGILATFAGFAAFFFSWKFPAPVYQTLSLLGGLTTPLSMLLIGSLLARSSLRKTLASPILWGVSAFRLLVLPLTALWVLVLLGLPRDMIKVGVVITAMPAAANLTLLASEYSPHPEKAGQIVFISTLGALVTIPLVVLLGEMMWKGLS